MVTVLENFECTTRLSEASQIKHSMYSKPCYFQVS